AGVRLRPQQAGYRFVRLQEALGLGADAARLRISAVPSGPHSGTQPAQPEVSDADRVVEAIADSGRQCGGSAPGQEPGLTHPMTMETLLFLAHRLPYPPNKGDKVRSHHLLRHLAQRYRIVLGSCIDEPAAWQH